MYKDLLLDSSYPALVIFDVFKGAVHFYHFANAKRSQNLVCDSPNQNSYICDLILENILDTLVKFLFYWLK